MFHDVTQDGNIIKRRARAKMPLFFFFSLHYIDMSSHNEWTILEKLLLTQAVYKYGENMWFQVARVIKQHDLVQLQGIERAPDFYSQKVSLLVEEIPSKKKRVA